MKILQIINSHALQDGGAQRLVLEMHRSYLAQGHDSHLLSLMRSPVDEPNTYTLGLRNPYRGNALARLCRFLKQSRWDDVDIIHVHLFPAQLWVAIAAKWLRRRAALVTTEHNTFNRRRGTTLGQWCDRLTLSSYRRIACIGPATSEALAHWQPQIKDKLVVIPNGIDLKRYADLGENTPNENTPIVISVGRISEQKNYETAIRAVELLRERKFEYWIVGQDELNGQMQRLVGELDLGSHVQFLGYQADIPNRLHQADIYLLTSLWEGFGLAVAEAMAAGLPIVCSDVPGVREVVGVTAQQETPVGLLIDPSSPSNVAKRLTELLDAPELRVALGKNAKERAQQFDINHTIEGYLKMYNEVLASPA